MKVDVKVMNGYYLRYHEHKALRERLRERDTVEMDKKTAQMLAIPPCPDCYPEAHE